MHKDKHYVRVKAAGAIQLTWQTEYKNGCESDHALFFAAEQKHSTPLLGIILVYIRHVCIYIVHAYCIYIKYYNIYAQSRAPALARGASLILGIIIIIIHVFYNKL